MGSAVQTFNTPPQSVLLQEDRSLRRSADKFLLVVVDFSREHLVEGNSGESQYGRFLSADRLSPSDATCCSYLSKHDHHELASTGTQRTNLMNYEAELEIAITAARAGGQVLMRHLASGVQMRDKSAGGGKSYDLVSDADLESEQCIAQIIGDAFPTHELLGEEELSGDTDAEHLWIIDPLDGTNNFAHAVPFFSVSIAYFHNGQPVVGAVLNPSSNELFTAVKGRGAFRNEQPIKVDDATTLSKSLIGCGFYYDRGEMMRCTLAAINEFFENDIHGIRRFGSAALDLCMVASGLLGVYFEYQLSPWDFAAGQLIVTEAGGKVTTATGSRIPIDKASMLATNKHLHAPAVAITRKFHP